MTVLGATRHYTCWNVSNVHWILLVVRVDKQRIEVFDGCAVGLTATHNLAATKFLDYLSSLSGDDKFTTFDIVLRGRDVINQQDGTSCGVFAAIVFLHLVSDCSIRLSNRIKTWRQFILCRILQLIPLTSLARLPQESIECPESIHFFD